MSSNVTRAELDGAAVYTETGLSIYDTVVLTLSNPYVWGCHTDHMLALYTEHTTDDHLDIGPGTGWYLRETTFPPDPRVALFDLNENSLAMAADRLRRRGISPHLHSGSILHPLPIDHRFGSVAANSVLHCVPGRWDAKGVAFEHIAAVTADDGVFFGSTVLSEGVPSGRLAWAVRGIYNQLGIFHNGEDDLDGLRRALSQAFAEVVITVRGSVALWTARGPRR
ncbi:class I SAM-dependent methyltransferase [Nocardia sp. NPDC048505]|uniref:class I SAM-dependent methyltransferase n=1 Tax=unclassified Nocardia TaxID=2637762 RepID=UPI0033D2972E